MPSLTVVMPPDFPAGLLIGNRIFFLFFQLTHLSYTSPTPFLHL